MATPTLADALRTELRRNVEQLRAFQPALGSGAADAEAVHESRVAIRRIRSALRAYRPVLDAGWAADTSAELGWLANQLDAVRDADVRRERLEAAIATLVEQSPRGVDGGNAALLRRAELERHAAIATMVAAQVSPRHELINVCLAELHDAPPISPRAGAAPGELVPRLLDRPWRDLRAAARAARSTPGSVELHALRIRAKQLRYASELAAPLLGPTAQRVARACAALQGSLGEHRDALDTADWLVGAAQAPELAFLAGQLFAGEQRRAAVALDSIDGEWREVRRRWRRFVAGTLR